MAIRLLLIEDNQIDQMAFERFAKYERLDYDYMIARSLSEAKQLLRTNVRASRTKGQVFLFGYL